MATEEDRMIAILQGSYIAKIFPKAWYGIEERKEVQQQTDAEKLKDQLAEKFKRLEARRKK